MSLKFGEIGPWPTGLAALEHLKKSHRLIMEKMTSSHFLRYFFIYSFSYLQAMRICIKAWMSSKFSQIRSLVSMATDSDII